MPRWLWFAPLALLVAAAAVGAFRWGWIAATITETDVITTYAQRYLTEGGATARLTDCVAVPGIQPGVWIVVRCSGPEARFDYPVDRFGRLLVIPAVTPPRDTPET
ncbi:hypothetical protein [uncultured Roseobacter sp.]|uniref:hypothetical protein n=1 Tax=uncultured Roseobacter sp. TaxID=114847 RepID=UPI00262A2458|nr:hypothetical protein [uncultured Roseobacter sp.]